MEYLKKDNITEYFLKFRRQKMNRVNLDDNRILETQEINQDGLPAPAGLTLLGE